MTTQKLIKYTLLDINGQPLDFNQELKINVLETSGNYLLHKDLLRHLNSQKQGTSSTRTRSEVKGGGRKPWKQKGTGRARAGSNRSPLWKGGGVTFGPKPKKYPLKVNKKERQLTLQTLLYSKRKNILIISELEKQFNTYKTEQFLKICKTCKIDFQQKTLLVVSEKTAALKCSTQNIKSVELILSSNLNTLSLLKAKQIILTPESLNDIKEIYCG